VTAPLISSWISARGDDVVVPARNLTAASKNIAPQYPQFGNLTLAVGKQGFMEWTVAVEAGRYHLHFLYASGESRPCHLSLNGQKQSGEVLGNPTGGFYPEHLRWQSYGPFELPKGKIAIRLATQGLMPHLKGLIVSPREVPPDPSVFRDVGEEAVALAGELKKLRAALAHQVVTQPKGDLARAYLSRLDVIEGELVRFIARPGSAGSLAARTAQFNELRREAVVAFSPLGRTDKILFVKRFTYQSSHYYTDYIDGCRDYGGNLCVLQWADGQVRELVPQFRKGIFGRFDLSPDGSRVVFDYKARPEVGFRIYEVHTDGSGLRQLTFDPPEEQEQIARYSNRGMTQWAGRPLTYRHQTDDLHPCYLPDGGVCFVSTRCRHGILCDGPDVFTTTLLYRMDRDGRNLQQLSWGPLSESTPSITNDGRILYTRWEYVDKGDVVVKCLWAMHPDGTHAAEVFGNDIDFPDGFLYGRALPGVNHRYVTVGVPHMPLGVGTVIRLDIDRPIRTRAPMDYLTPDVDVRSEYGFFHRRGEQWVRDERGPLFADPYPLSDRCFLVACNPDRPCSDPRAYGLHLLDEFGNSVPIYRDPAISCWQPVPLRPRPAPPVIAPVRADREPRATVLLSDVYEGLEEAVRRGTIKYLRIMETLPRPWSARRLWDGDERYQQHAVISMNASLHPKVLHGIVPVEADGSACFTVPADKNLFFQALDEEFMEVQRMRTFVNFRPGETRSCVGCHPRRELAPPYRGMSAALQNPPTAPLPQPGESAPRPIYYLTDVQPTLDRHCVRCHGPGKLDAGLDLSGGLTELFNRSYEGLLGRNFVRIVRENDPKTGNVAPVPPYSLGSHASKLVHLIRQGHEGVRLSREEFIRLVTWIDSNAQYYGSYEGRRNLKYQGFPDFRPRP
jgi:hypothetical protein